MKRLPLTNGQAVLVDDDVHEWASREQWWPGGYKGRYAMRFVPDGRSVRTVYLHKAILPVDAELEVDHIDGDTFNCTRRNLRPATRSQQNQNIRHRVVRAATGVRGVYYNRAKRRYRAMAWFSRRRVYGGNFLTLAEAEAAVIAFRRTHYTHAPECSESEL